MQYNVLTNFHRRSIVIVFNVKEAKARTGRGYFLIDKYFSVGQDCALSCSGEFIVKSIFTGTVLYAASFFLI